MWETKLKSYQTISGCQAEQFSQEKLRLKTNFPTRVEGSDDERKQLSFDNFPLKMMTDSSDIGAIKKQLMRQKLIEFSSIMSRRLHD